MAKIYPQSIEILIDKFAELPGIGTKSAERLAFHILSSSRDNAMSLAVAIRDVKRNIKACKRCFNVAEEDLCHICNDNGRNAKVICVVELPRDIIALEKCGGYEGVYHVLQGKLDPAAGIGPDNIRISELMHRIRKEGIEEIILALNPTTEGDVTASYIIDLINKEEMNIILTKLARGLASGTDLESTAPSSLEYALNGRQRVN